MTYDEKDVYSLLVLLPPILANSMISIAQLQPTSSKMHVHSLCHQGKEAVTERLSTRSR